MRAKTLKTSVHNFLQKNIIQLIVKNYEP